MLILLTNERPQLSDKDFDGMQDFTPGVFLPFTRKTDTLFFSGRWLYRRSIGRKSVLEIRGITG